MLELLKYYFSTSRVKIQFNNPKISILSFFDKKTILSKKSRIERMVILRESKVDDYSYIGHNSNFLRTNIGKFCSISRNVNCGLGSHPTNFISSSPIFFSPNSATGINWVTKEGIFDELPKPTFIGNDVWIGMNVTIPGGVSIGDGAIIAAHSVVTKNVPPYAIVGGVPAKIIKFRFSKDIISRLEELQWWNFPEKSLKHNLSKFQKNIEKIEDLNFDL